MNVIDGLIAEARKLSGNIDILEGRLRQQEDRLVRLESQLRTTEADLAAYKHWHTEVLGVLPQVQSITTFVVMGSPKDDRA